MKTFAVNPHFNARVDNVVISLRREGYSAYAEASGEQRYVVTNASRGVVLITAGNGLFLNLR